MLLPLLMQLNMFGSPVPPTPPPPTPIEDMGGSGGGGTMAGIDLEDGKREDTTEKEREIRLREDDEEILLLTINAFQWLN
jgi:hypothetical protein